MMRCHPIPQKLQKVEWYRGDGGGRTHYGKDSTLPLPESLLNFEDSQISVLIVCLLQTFHASQGKMTGKFGFYLS